MRRLHLRQAPAAAASRSDPASGPTSLDDATVRALFSIGLHLQATLPDADGASEQHLRAALEQLDQLIRTIRGAAFAAAQDIGTVDGIDPTEPSGRLAPLTPFPRNAPALLHQRLDTVEVLQARLHQVAVALALSQEAAADLLDHLAHAEAPPDSRLSAHAGQARTAARICREFAQRMDGVRPTAHPSFPVAR